MSETVYDLIAALLSRNQVPFRRMDHAPVYTSEEAAQIRGTPLHSGAKALICKGDDRFVLCVVPADCKLDSKLLRRACGWRRLRFATADEVLQLTGLTPGSIPPFGSLFQLKTYCDEGLADNERINFNAGDHAISISMAYDDYIAVEQPVLGKFARPS